VASQRSGRLALVHDSPKEKTVSRNTSPIGRQNAGAGTASEGMRIAWLSILFLFLSVIVPSAFATQQMSFLRKDGADLHMLGATICAVAGVIGAIASIRMLLSKTTDRNRRTASLATLAGTVIFIVGAVVIYSTDNSVAPRVGGIHGEAVQ
jgi:hypothetical protein